MNIVSQRDVKWKDIKVGSGTSTIGQVGCTITALGYLVGLTPDKVNEKINAVGGYQVNLVIWTKMQEAIGVTCYRYYGWDNQKVLDAITANGAVLGEVDAAAIGGTGKHWVVLTGNKKCQDPWTGTERPTSDFNFTGYATVVFDKSEMGNYVNDNIYREYDLTNKESMKVCVDDHIKVSEGFYVEKTLYETLKGQYTENIKASEELSKKLAIANTDLETTRTALKTTQESLARELGSQHDWAEVATQAQEERDEQKKFSEKCLASMEDDLKLTTTGSDTKETRLQNILDATMNTMEIDQKYQDKITALQDENNRLLEMTKPVAEIKTSLLFSELLRRMSSWHKK